MFLHAGVGGGDPATFASSIILRSIKIRNNRTNASCLPRPSTHSPHGVLHAVGGAPAGSAVDPIGR